MSFSTQKAETTKLALYNAKTQKDKDKANSFCRFL